MFGILEQFERQPFSHDLLSIIIMVYEIRLQSSNLFFLSDRQYGKKKLPTNPLTMHHSE